MAYTSPSNKATGDVVSAAHWNQDIVANSQASVPDIFTTAGDMAYATAADTCARLGIGSARKMLITDGSTPGWSSFVYPSSNSIMGATGNDRHVESGSGSTSGSSLAVTFANAFASAPNVVACSDQATVVSVSSVTTTGFTATINGGGNGTVWWIAEGAD